MFPFNLQLFMCSTSLTKPLSIVGFGVVTTAEPSTAIDKLNLRVILYRLSALAILVHSRTALYQYMTLTKRRLTRHYIYTCQYWRPYCRACLQLWSVVYNVQQRSSENGKCYSAHNPILGTAQSVYTVLPDRSFE